MQWCNSRFFIFEHKILFLKLDPLWRLGVEQKKKEQKKPKTKQKTKQLCNSLGVKGIKNILIAARIYTKTYTNTAEIDGKTAVGFLYDQS